MAIDEKTKPRPIDFEEDVIQRRPLTTQAGLGAADPTSPSPGVLANDDNIVFTTVNNLVNWARSRSPWPLGYGLACCAIEMMAASMSHHDTARFGMEVFRSSPSTPLCRSTSTSRGARRALRLSSKGCSVFAKKS